MRQRVVHSLQTAKSAPAATAPYEDDISNPAFGSGAAAGFDDEL